MDVKIIQNILAECYRLEYKECADEKEEKTESPVYIEGFLGGGIPEKPSVRNSPQEQPDKKQEPLTQITESVPVSIEHQEKPEAEVKEKAVSDIKDIKPIEVAQEQPIKKGRKIIEWSLSKEDLRNCVAIDLEQSTRFQFEKFLENLLVTPILPLEIGVLGKEPVVFIYMAEKLYYFSTNNPVIVDDMLPYISQSKFRKIVCYEPYKIYSYLYKQGITSVELFSIKVFADCFEEFKKNNKQPKTLIKKVFNKENRTGAHDLLFSMSHYQKLYGEFQENYTTPDSYNKRMLLCHLLGLSYTRNHISNTALPLFKEESANGYIFTYKQEEHLEEPYKPVQIKFAWNDTSDFPVEELLVRLEKASFYYKHQIILLSYSRNVVTFAIDKNRIVSACEIINNATCSIAEERKKTPINVAVTILTE